MAYALYYDAPGTPEIYRRVSERLGPDRPEGLLVHLVTVTEGGLRHLDVWDSQARWERFRDTRMRSAVDSVLGDLGYPPAEDPVEHVLELADLVPAGPVPVG